MRMPIAAAAALLTLASVPAAAHFTGGATPHLHLGDALGVLAVVALTVGAGWLERRHARARRRRDLERTRPHDAGGRPR